MKIPAAPECSGAAYICGCLCGAAGFIFRFDAVSPYLPRIPGEWGYCLFSWVAFGKAVITPQRRAKRAPQGSPASLWEAVRKYHYSPYRSLRTGRCSGLQGLNVDRSASLSSVPPFTSWRPGGAPHPAAVWFSYPQYRVFSFSAHTKGTKNAPFTYRPQKAVLAGTITSLFQKIMKFLLCRSQALHNAMVPDVLCHGDLPDG